MNTMLNYKMYVPTHTLFGTGELNHLHTQPMPGHKALLVISNGKATKANGYLSRTQEQLTMAGVDFVLFDQIEPNPLNSTVMAGAAMAREKECDFIVALGGGSCMDAAKAIAVVATNEGDYWDYIPCGTGKGKPIVNNPLPIVAITTTAGTGSETDSGCVITNAETNEKTGFLHPSLYPVLAIVDPELMLTVPAKLTAYQGFDALFHSIEGYISNGANLMSDMYALTAIENVSHSLARAIQNGNDIEARTKVAFANTLSGTVMCVGLLTSEHSLEHAMSAYHQTLPHGAGLIMISKAFYTHFINQHVCDERFVQMAKTMGFKEAKEPMDFIKALTQLQADCGVDNLKMSDYGITPDEFEKFAINAKITMGFLFHCDREPLSNEDCIAIYAASYQ
ncbi:MAG: iron-containing alcohol dehydrogenase [Bacteroidaceae bacterium]